MGKILRPMVITQREWDKLARRDMGQWTKQSRPTVLQRDQYTCVYCLFSARKFLQVNHIGAEDDHRLENLETLCPACHCVQHIGINIARGKLTLFECEPDFLNMAAIVAHTRALVHKSVSWPEVEQRILQKFLRPGGQHFSLEQSLRMANDLLHSIKPPAFRAELPPGYAILFHKDDPWMDYEEKVWKWVCIPGAHYVKEVQPTENTLEGIGRKDLPGVELVGKLKTSSGYNDGRIRPYPNDPSKWVAELYIPGKSPKKTWKVLRDEQTDRYRLFSTPELAAHALEDWIHRFEES